MRLAIGFVAFGLVVGLLNSASAAGSCDGGDPWQGHCSVENTGEQVDIGASETNPGNSDGGSTDDDDSAGPAVPPAAPIDNPCTRQSCVLEIVVPPEVTIDDLASFRPATPSLTGEPVGFGVVGAPTNVVAAASEQFLTGDLLGWDVTVRFTPAGYIFDYGDGSSARSSTGGASWPALGQAQFTPTSTSHVYRARGTYPVSVTVQYSAAVNFGSGNWRPVAGFVTSTSGGYDVQVVAARTALVDKTCLENSSGPGC